MFSAGLSPLWAMLPQPPILGFTGCGWLIGYYVAAFPFAVARFAPNGRGSFTTKNDQNWIFGGVFYHRSPICSNGEEPITTEIGKLSAL